MTWVCKYAVLKALIRSEVGLIDKHSLCMGLEYKPTRKHGAWRCRFDPCRGAKFIV